MVRLNISCPHCQKVFLASISQVTTKARCLHCHLASPFPNASPSEKVWILCKGRKQMGPFTRPQLAELAASRQLTRCDLVVDQRTSTAMEAQSIPGLFAPEEDESHPKLVLSPAIAPERPEFRLTLDDFQILRKIGAGGMGTVFLGRQLSVSRPVALKVMPEALASDDSFVFRFRREEEILASLDHPNIVKFLGAGQHHGVPFMVMEFIEGSSTANLIAKRGKLAVGDALFIFRQTIEAMAYAFAHNIVHRDIKPENIMITRAGQTKIADLGLAKSMNGQNPELDLTETGTGLGSPKYMAPEQAHNAKTADQRSDIFALGGVLYFLLTGEAPFKGATNIDLLLAKERKQFIPPRRLNPDVPARLDLMIEKMLAKEPKYRYQSYADLLRDVDALGLAAAQLSFDAANVFPASGADSFCEIVQVLLIDKDPENARLASDALAENSIASNLVTVRDGAEARAYFRHEGKFVVAPQPHLIIVGNNLDPQDTLLTLAEIKVSETLCGVPLVILVTSAEEAKFFESHGYRVSRIHELPTDVGQFHELFESIRDLCLTVLEIRPGREDTENTGAKPEGA